MPATFHLQGHRGARGQKPENTLPSFECAFDAGVTSIETDVHLTRDGVPVLAHDPTIHARQYRGGPPDPVTRPALSTLTLAQLRSYQADKNPDPQRFPTQDNHLTPLARLFAEQHALDPWTPPTLADLLAFAEVYTGSLGREAGKSETHRAQASRVLFDLELKRVPFHPESIGDGFDGQTAGLLERQVVAAVRTAGVVARTIVRSFDHRCVRLCKELEPGLTTAVLIAATAPVEPAQLSRDAGAALYCPDYQFLDEGQIKQCHVAGVQVLPWTVNEPGDWERLVGWGVDGLTTDYPERLAEWLRGRGIDW